MDRQGLAHSQDEHVAQGGGGVGEHVQQVRSIVAVRRLQGIGFRPRRRTAGPDGLREGGLAMPPRIPVTKTPKVYVGGQFIRSESGRVFPVREVGSGKREAGLLGNIPQCTRKDLRNAVEAAAKAGPDWAHRTPYNRGQIIYRLAEMLESRSD